MQRGHNRKAVFVQAVVLTEAFNVNLEELVTKDFLAVQMAEVHAKIDANHRVFIWTQAIDERKAAAPGSNK